MTVNIIKFGGKTSNWIDINLCLEDDICQLRIRDNGVNFNPLEYSYDHEEFDIHGIELVKKDVYKRQLNSNKIYRKEDTP